LSPFLSCSTFLSLSLSLTLSLSLRLLADIQDLPQTIGKGPKWQIAEVVYDALIGIWGYLHLRKDKTEPNYIDTVIGVFMEQAEGISVEELQYRIASKNEGDDDYHGQINKMKLKLLDWQSKQTPSSSSRTKK
jgi:hypothetical protein